MTLEQSASYSRWLTPKQIEDGFQLTDPLKMTQITGIDKAGNPTFKGNFPITKEDVGKIVILINNWNGSWNEEAKSVLPAKFTGGFVEKIKKAMKDAGSNADNSTWLDCIQYDFVQITEDNWEPLSSLVNKSLIINLGKIQLSLEEWLGEKYLIEQSTLPQPLNPFSLRVPTSGAGDMAYLLATSIFGLQQVYDTEGAFNVAMANVNCYTFADRFSYLMNNMIGATSQQSWTNAQNGTQGIQVFSSDVLSQVLYNGYCSTSIEEAGYESGDDIYITLNALGSGIQTPFLPAVGTATLGSNYSWTANTAHDNITQMAVSYDIWSTFQPLLDAIQNGQILLWNSSPTVPSTNPMTALVPQTTPYTGTYTGAFPVLPSSSTTASN